MQNEKFTMEKIEQHFTGLAREWIKQEGVL
jgi:hypothetical protein